MTVKTAEHRRIDAFELWCWRRLLRVPWTARGSNQSILKEISPGCLLEGLMLKVKLQFFGLLMRRVDSLEKTLMLGGIGGRRRRGCRGWDGWMASPTRWTWVWVDSGSWWWTVRPEVLRFTGSQRVGHNWATDLNWTKLMLKIKLQYFDHLMRSDSLEKTLMLGKIEGRREGDDRGWDGWMASPTLWTWIWVSFRSWWWTGRPGVLQSTGSEKGRHAWAIELNASVCPRIAGKYIHRTGNYFTFRWERTLTACWCLNLERIMLSESSQSQEKYWTIWIVWGF